MLATECLLKRRRRKRRIRKNIERETDGFSFQRYTRGPAQTQTGLFVNAAEFLFPSKLPRRREALLILFHKRSDKQAAVYECCYAARRQAETLLFKDKNRYRAIQSLGNIGSRCDCLLEIFPLSRFLFFDRRAKRKGKSFRSG